MNRRPAPNSYKRHRFPTEIISHAVWLYFRFCLSYRDVEEMMAERGVTLTYEAVRYWCRKFGQVYAHQLRRRHSRFGDKWHLDEVFLSIKGNGITSGGPSTKTGISSTSSCNVAEIKLLPRHFFGSC
jgi:putative transposase